MIVIYALGSAHESQSHGSSQIRYVRINWFKRQSFLVLSWRSLVMKSSMFKLGLTKKKKKKIVGRCFHCSQCFSIECFHMTSRRPYWCPKTMKRRPCWCPKSILWELNSFLMQTLSFVPINLHRCWPREWKHSIKRFTYVASSYAN